MIAATSKPPYAVPSMETINALEPNGLKIVSTFSGCGGSCLGFKMAGYEVLWANEFVPAAQDTYRANHPATLLDVRDIREITGADILAATGLKIGEIDVLEGSPPCASFSTAGKREKGWGGENKYSDTSQRTDDLFLEYVRLLDELKPRAFVAENVSGLVKGTSKGYFKIILQAMKDRGYNVKAQLLDSQWLGVPQARQRIIFVGIRNDLDLEPVFPTPLPYRYSLRDALPWITHVKHGGTPNNWKSSDEPSPTIVATGAIRAESAYLSGGTWVEAYVDSPEPITHDQGRDIRLDKYAIAAEWDKLKPGESSDRYFNLVRTSLDKPVPTVTAYGGSINTAAVTHPTERRKFTMQELRRVCSFPDDFILTGTYAQQWERLGRSVPPLMMYAVARELATVLKQGAE